MVFEIISTKEIFRKHFESLRKDTKVSWALFIFIIIPALAPLLLILFNKPLNAASVGILVTAFALFTGLMLNMVVLLFNIVTRATSELALDDSKSKPRILLERLYANSLYSVIVATLVLVVLIFVTILELWLAPNWFTASHSIWFISNPLIIPNLWLLLASIFVYFMTVHFLMNLLMIIKRLFVLLSVQLKKKTKK